MRVIYVDDDREELSGFRKLAENIKEIQKLRLFDDGLEALEFARNYMVDAAFLDINMPKMDGIALAKALQCIQPEISIVFLTAHTSYALQAFEVDAVDYILKPYTAEQIERSIGKIKTKHVMPYERSVYFQTMPRFEVFVNGELLPISKRKVKEYLALLVDFAGSSVNSEQAITYLWENRPNDHTTKALLRMTAKRLRDVLSQEKIEHILIEENGVRAIDTRKVSCDYYQILDGNEEAMEKYHGEYMVEYSWAEITNAKLEQMISQFRNNHI